MNFNPKLPPGYSSKKVMGDERHNAFKKNNGTFEPNSLNISSRDKYMYIQCRTFVHSFARGNGNHHASLIDLWELRGEKNRTVDNTALAYR